MKPHRKPRPLARLAAAILAMAMALTACGSQQTLKAADDPPTPLSYLVRESQHRWQAQQGLGEWLLRCSSIPGSSSNWSDHDWRQDNMVLKQVTDSGQTLAAIHFDWIGFDPDKSTFAYGDTKVISTTDGEAPGSAYLLVNKSDDPLEFSRDETVTEHQERSTSTDQKIAVDVGTETKATIGGDEFGASLEMGISTHLGIETDTATATAESHDKTVTVHLATDVAPAHSTLATVVQATVRSQTPFTLDGVWDAGITVAWDDGTAWTHSPCLTAIQDTDSANKTTLDGMPAVTWASWDDFTTMLAGENTDWPSANPGNVHPDSHAVAVIEADWSHRIEMTGIQKRTYQDSTEAMFTDVTGQDPDDVVKDHGIDTDHVITGGG